MLLDAKTLLWANAILTLMMSGTLWAAIWARFRPGEALWIVSLLLVGASQAMLALRGTVPDAISVTGANTLLALALSTAYLSISRVMQRPARPILAWGGAAAVAAFSLVWRDDTAIRVISSNSVFCAQQLLLALTVMRARLPYGQRARRVMTAGYLIEALMFAIRVAGAAHDPDQFTQIFVSGHAQVATYLIALGGIVLTSVSLLVLHRDALDHENRHLSTIDPLTGIYNRRMLEDLGTRAVSAAARTGGPVALLMIDLDHFKRVNDRYGHPAGDRVLRALSGLMGAHLRQHDVLGRYGGEEFCAVLPGTGPEGALRSAERIRQAIENTQFDVGGSFVPMTVSIGLSGTAAAPRDISMDELVRLADRSLYEAKEGGRNRCVVTELAQASAR
jgi:diguanylate cyclase (GGDEF)-like protein